MSPVERQGLIIFFLLSAPTMGWCLLEYALGMLLVWLELPLPGHTFSPLDLIEFAEGNQANIAQEAKQELLDALYVVFVLTSSGAHRMERFIEG